MDEYLKSFRKHDLLRWLKGFEDVVGKVDENQPKDETMTKPATESEPVSELERTVSITETSGSGAGSSSFETLRRMTLARPQSTTWTSPNAPTITLEGLRSRWITRREWA